MKTSRPSLDRRRVDMLPRELIIDELRRVANQLGGRRFSRHDFDRHATACKGSAVLSRFGTWAAAISAIGTPLTDHQTNRKQFSDAQLLGELARIWNVLGHRPSKLEWEGSDAAYSYTTYKQRFGGWVKACTALVSGDAESAQVIATESSADAVSPTKRIPAEKIRTVPPKLRLRVLTRDQFRCALCGRTPALNPGTVLHIDHIVPFSGGGRTIDSNLRTLCDQCNWGKGAAHEDIV